MQDYEYKDEGGRFLCKLHHRLRCDECHYVSDLQEQNKRYRDLLKKIKEMTRYDDCREAEIYELVSDELEGEE